MKTISDYTIYCTPEQTKKALDLGAPIAFDTYFSSIGIENAISGRNKNEYVLVYNPHRHDDYLCKVLTIPTAEQMIGWLEEQGIIFDIDTEYDKSVLVYVWDCENKSQINNLFHGSRKEATLAAIDAALEYLKENK